MGLTLWIPIAFLLIAICYSMVGFGGGSSYLAILVLAGLSYEIIPAQALICNVIVATGGFYHFYKGGYFKPRNIWPFLITSIPLAYVGGRIPIREDIFCIVLGVALFVTSMKLWMNNGRVDIQAKSLKYVWIIGPIIGALIGFLSGMVGIGGGIFLSPVLLLLGWAHAKESACAASLFIVMNSLAGLAGQIQKGHIDWVHLIPLAVMVLIGGQIGARIGSYHLPKDILRKGISLLVFIVAIRLVWRVI